jgi:hypothetical protein
MSQIDNVVSCFLNIFFGWRRYRVKFVYKEPTGRISFDFYKTVAVRNARFIDCARDLKRAAGNASEALFPHQKYLLCNGTVHVEPICYLGRWKDN